MRCPGQLTRTSINPHSQSVASVGQALFWQCRGSNWGPNPIHPKTVPMTTLYHSTKRHGFFILVFCSFIYSQNQLTVFLDKSDLPISKLCNHRDLTTIYYVKKIKENRHKIGRKMLQSLTTNIKGQLPNLLNEQLFF